MMELLVRSRRQEAHDIVSFELVNPTGDLLPPFSAGAHIDVETLDGQTRQYSLCNSPMERHRYVIAVLREEEGRGGSKWMHDHILAGDIVRCGMPRNMFSLVEGGAGPIILIAGGIGITPILSMAEHLATTGRKFELHYCVRSLHRAAFVERIRDSGFADRLTLYVSDDASGPTFVPRLVVRGPSDERHVYVCGPEGLLQSILTEASEQGWRNTNVHREVFARASSTQATRLTDAEFQVELASSGRSYNVPPGRTVVEVLSAEGIEIPISCEQGVCGTCLTRVLAGEPDHRDCFMTDDERASNDRFTPCCSRAFSSKLILDL
ncbi:PDR/VanB family oxidoreductase [Burkholderia cepacia]|uniref:PDR/VanB family oxidoreductase n=1 Tax=Burkholderia cepacia TaxID=292 RepID=UPI001F4642DB|nr:PDR/VanB family oxidoreductase [Burkholderia cepacia]MCE4124468.1 PDR/VanB family oxidoreductase [Burkholderia cepacia]